MQPCLPLQAPPPEKSSRGTRKEQEWLPPAAPCLQSEWNPFPPAVRLPASWEDPTVPARRGHTMSPHSPVSSPRASIPPPPARFPPRHGRHHPLHWRCNPPGSAGTDGAAPHSRMPDGRVLPDCAEAVRLQWRNAYNIPAGSLPEKTPPDPYLRADCPGPCHSWPGSEVPRPPDSPTAAGPDSAPPSPPAPEPPAMPGRQQIALFG